MEPVITDKPMSVSQNSKQQAERVHMEVYDDFEKLEHIREDWDRFVESVGGEIYHTYDWCRLWWKYYGDKRDLKIFVFRNSSGLTGIIPLFFETIRIGPLSLRAVKLVATDFTISTVTVPVDRRFMSEVLSQFCEKLACYRWDILHIGPVSGIYEQFNEAVGAFRQSCGKGHTVREGRNGQQIYFELDGDLDKYLSTLKKKERQYVRSCYRKLEESNTTLYCPFIDERKVDIKFADFVDMHQSQWHRAGESGHFGDWPKAQDFHFEVARAQLKNNRLRLMEIIIGGMTTSYEYGYKFGDRYYWILGARRDYEPSPTLDIGKLAFAEKLKRAFYEKIRIIDSMQGFYDYKIRLGGRLFPVRSINVHPRSLLTLMKIFIFTWFYRFFNICYYKIWFCRVAPKLRLKRGLLWRFWIRGHFLIN